MTTAPHVHTIKLQHLPTQAAFYNCTDQFAAYVAGIGAGKTRAASDWFLTSCLRFPKARLFILSNTFSQLRSGTMASFYEACIRWGFKYIDRIHDKRVVLPDLGCTIEVWSCDDSELFRSLEIDFAWIDEAHKWKQHDFEVLVGRCRGSDQSRALYPGLTPRLRMTANPPHHLDHWLVQQCTEPVAATGKPAVTLFQASTYDNYMLPESYVSKLKEIYDPELAAIELGGTFGELGRGKIWRMFARHQHVLSETQAVERKLPPLDWDPREPICWSHDFNLDPLCSVFFQWRRVEVPGYQSVVMYVLGELRIRHSIINAALNEFLSDNAPEWLQQARTIARRGQLILYGDSSGEAGNRQTGESDWAALRKYLASKGFVGDTRVPAANPKKRDRFNAGNAKLMNANNQVGVIIHERCKYLIRDIERAYYKPGTSDPEVVKVEDGATSTHLADAFSYPIAQEFPIKEHPRGHISLVR